MSGNARVHDLAREFGVDSRTILSLLKEDGHFVKSASSTVEAPVARRLRDRLQQGRWQSPSAQARQRPTPPLQNVDQDPLDLAALLFDRDRRSLRPAPKARPPRGQNYTPMSRWDFHLFSDVERRAWTAHGVTDPDVAFRCAEAGLRPQDLNSIIDGTSVLRWLQSGEGPGQVIGRLRARGLWRREA